MSLPEEAEELLDVLQKRKIEKELRDVEQLFPDKEVLFLYKKLTEVLAMEGERGRIARRVFCETIAEVEVQRN